jgi:hypothetical protein
MNILGDWSNVKTATKAQPPEDVLEFKAIYFGFVIWQPVGVLFKRLEKDSLAS